MKISFVSAQTHIGYYRLATLVLMFLFGFSAVHAQSGRKLALLIGIGDYPAAGGWLPINAPNDLLVISDALRQRGFRDENIVIVKNEQATRAGIENIWKTVFLPRVQRGDVIYFQFSGHGQQVADNNGNNDELDGYDEAIVPYDSPKSFKSGVNEGQKLIRDDDLNDMFNDLRQRLGPSGNLMVVLDACHSGTGTRGMAPARGTDEAMASDEFKKKLTHRTGDNFSAPQFGSAGASELAPMAAFFGSAHNQLNFETRDEQGQLIGSLSYALSKKFSQASPNTTYRGLFDQIRVEMGTIAPNQQPQAEGSLDQELLGGQLHKRPLNYTVNRWNDPGSVVVSAGWVHGLNEGAVVGLYPAETRDPAQAVPLAKGTVRNARPFEATLELDNSLNEQVARSCWAYVLEQNFGDLRVGLAIQLPEGHPVRQELLNKTARYPMIRIDEAPEVFLTGNSNGIQLIGTGDVMLEEIGNNMSPAVAAERLFRRILDFTQAKYIRKLDVRGNYLNVDFEIVPVRFDPNTLKVAEVLSLDSKRDALGNIHFQDGDAFTIRVNNRGNKKAYFTLLDIQPDNTINLLIPGQDDQQLDEFQVEPGKSMQVDKIFTIGPPAGVEVFKLIATLKSVDLRPVSTSRGAATRDVKDPLEQLFGQTFFNDEVKTRGGKTVNLAAGSMHVHSTTFIIDK
ncbi:MAG: caspase family protein [Saprospiraceae bacterium]